MYRVSHQNQLNEKKELKLSKKENELIELKSKIQNFKINTEENTPSTIEENSKTEI